METLSKESKKKLQIFGIDKTLLIVILPFVVILGFGAGLDLYRGVITGADVYFQMARAYGGIAIVFLSLLFINLEPKLHPRKFFAFQAFFVAGSALVLPYIQTGTPFSTTASFEVGSFALIVTGFFIRSKNREYHNILLYSTTATIALFVAGMFSAFKDVVATAAPSTGAAAATTYLITAFFLVGVIDLTFLSVFLSLLLIAKIRANA